jgi:hypothetical protein
MEHPHFFKLDYRYASTFSLADFSAQFHEERFDITPLDVPARGSGEDQFESALVLSLHAEIVPRSGTGLRWKFP